MLTGLFISVTFYLQSRYSFCFYKDDGFQEVDIIIETPVSYQEAEKSALRIKCEKIVLPVISIDNFLKMKKKSGRNADELDMEELKKSNS